ncbi:DMSO/TMAO reductase YedYZ, molybdopterin-dependent catalytic subunit [Asanoa hainanensis]|uniref:DMSO/TMAO reductase YedYZ, molybdopterin-dependent catalytic subunit n=1 Tax=Asanoa hainanensis TaxID=560556 RepID=A0A239N7U1_9ACTN|nr:molybdopterin-dependent oxidoreductase [Asanoa hainanensis]SNT50258.1 DMSO/TMAO reductase YedYZ, molybdopterin-dependent catalytic subunit [Asanoa hainanensis]
MRPALWPCYVGVVSAAIGVSTGQVIAAISNPESGPVYAVGAMTIDATPARVKEFAVRTAGTFDKPLLLAGVVVVLAAVAAFVGLAAARQRWPGFVGMAVLGGIAVVAAVTRPSASLVDAVPALVSAAVASAALLVMLRRPGAPPEAAQRPRLLDRRAFVGGVALAVAGVAAAGAAGTSRVAWRAAARSRDDVRLPPPTRLAPPLPEGVEPGFVTSNADFYRVDTALTVPRVDVDRWTLTVRGMVDRPFEISFDELLEEPMIEQYVTLNCVSNEVGGPYIGTAKWLGVRLADLLRRAGVQAGADQIVARSVDGMTIGTPTATVLHSGTTRGTQPALICVGMNDEPLPLEHGFPARMLTPGVYGYAGSCKWLTDIELSTFGDFDAYWVRRGYAAQAPVKTSSRIDRPRPFARVSAGRVVVAGVGWAQGNGISTVEVQVDDDAWQPATLRPEPNLDTWVQWTHEWQAAPGSHTLRVRAVDRTGTVQTGDRAEPFPNGATGWHTVAVTVT